MEFMKGSSGTELIFWGSAIFGTMFFFLRVAAMVIGGFGGEDMADGDAGADADMDVDVDVDVDADHGSHSTASDAAFKLLSIHSLTGFFMIFGWIGLAAYKQFSLGVIISIVLALAAGLFTMYITAWMFKLVVQLSSRGKPFSVKDAVGQDATVYSRIPKDGRGKIQLPYEGITRYIEAVSDEGTEIDSFKNVRIVRAMDARTVSVRIKE